MNNLFSIHQLVKSYNNKTILEIDDLEFQSGQFVALMGKNGSGKSTLMRLMASQETFQAGDIKYQEQSLIKPTAQINPNLAFVSEDSWLPFSESLKFWCHMFQKLYKNFDLHLFEKLTANLEVDISNSFHSMSRGQKIKAVFCLLASKHPKVYILDEITSVLDSGSRWFVMDFLAQEAKAGALILMSTNIADEMQGFATDIVFLEKGRVLFKSPTSILTQQFGKFRLTKNHQVSANALAVITARRISYNSDDTVVYLYTKAPNLDLTIPGWIEDHRQITVSDLMSYFTTGREI